MPDTTGLSCPVCRSMLTATMRDGIEIDACARCRGVWLDRGELDKLIERSFDQQRPTDDRSLDRLARRYERDHDDHRDYRDGGYRHRRKSFLSELFD